jgi:hypothetical protein
MVLPRRTTFPEEALIAQMEDLRSRFKAKMDELSRAIKAQEDSGSDAPPGPEVRGLARQAHSLLRRYSRVAGRLQKMAGIPDSLIEAIERSQFPSYDDRWWRVEVEETPPTESLDETAPTGLERLLQIVDPDWLEQEAQKPYRLGREFLSSPLHMVSGTRIIHLHGEQGPQRFARMLLVCQDHLNKRDDLDFFSAAMFVPEVAVLGNSLDLIPALGEEAVRKLSRLYTMQDDMVTSTVYELLVGAACVRKGLAVTMLPEDRSRKSPDYRVHGLGAPGVIECKRRLGLTRFELEEARHIETLYASIRPALRDRGIHGAVQSSFRVPVDSVAPKHFAEIVLGLVRQDEDLTPTETPWGHIAFERLWYCGDLPLTRLYSPDFLEAVFGWPPLQDDWDGLLCEVEAPVTILVRSFREPLCLKWRSESPDALTKKARGITSLWANAAKQIPAGELGFIYIAYPEGARPALADARTRHVRDSSSEWWHRWSVRIPAAIIGRLYPRALGPGMPDLIESVLPGVAEGNESWLARFPTRVFTVSTKD